MSVARHNPNDAQGGAKALLWEERLALKEEFSFNSQFDRFRKYRRVYYLATARRDQNKINTHLREERHLLRQKRLENLRIAGPRDGLRGTLGDDSVGGDPFWYKRQLEKDGKTPLGPKTAFNQDDFITEMQQTSTILNSLSKSDRAQYIPVHYPQSDMIAGLAPHEAALLSPERALEQQYVDSHMMYASLLSTQKDIDLTPSLRGHLIDGLRREFHFLKENPTAQPKDLSNILTHYTQLGKPLNFNEEEKLAQYTNADHLADDTIQTLDINDRSLLEATKAKLSKLRGNVGIQQQIKTALEFSQNALERTMGLQNNPEFHDLSPNERVEYLEFIKEDLKLEQERLDRTIQLNIGEIQQLRQYDRIQLLPQDKIPYLPLPRFASRDLDTINSVPYIINERNNSKRMDGQKARVTHPFLFDTKNIFNNCMPIALNYTQCLRVNQWATDLESIPQCNQLATELFRCQQRETVNVQVNSTQSWGQVITKWLWGEENNTGGLQGQMDKLVNLPSPTAHQQAEFAAAQKQSYQPSATQLALQSGVVAPIDGSPEAQGWLTSLSLPSWDPHTASIIHSSPTHSPLSHNTPVSPELLHYQLSATNIDSDSEQLSRTGPLSPAQQQYFYQKQHHEDFANLHPGYRRYQPQDYKQSNSKLFASDHLYQHWVDPDDVAKMVDEDWEHLEKYGTAEGGRFDLYREHPFEPEERFNLARLYLPHRPPEPFGVDGFESHGSVTYLEAGGYIDPTGQTSAPPSSWW